VPSTKILTFYRKEAFQLEAKYAKPELLPGKTNPWIGRFSVKGVKADSKEDFMICKLKARLNLHGILNVESGYYVEDVEVEEPIPEEKKDEKKDKDADAMDTDAADKDKPKTRKVKKQVRKGDLPISAGTSSLDEASKLAAAEAESAMIMEDKLVADTEEKKNELETYIYEMRNKIDDQYSEFASEEEKTKLKAKLEASEDWLYDEGEDATKAVYVAKMDEIRAVAGPIVQRYFDKIEEERQAAQAIADAEAAKKKEEAARQKEMADAARAAAIAQEAGQTPDKADAEMTDAEPQKPDEIVEPEN